VQISLDHQLFGAELIEYEGYVHRVVFQAENYAVFYFRLLTDGKKQYKAVGKVPITQGEGEQFLLRGHWVEHPEFGEQFHVSEWEKRTPVGREAVITYLSSGLIEGIGKKTASRIVELLGDDALQCILKEGISALLRVPQIAKAKAERIYASIVSNLESEATISQLIKYGLSPSLAIRVYQLFGEAAVTELKKNPYRLLELPAIGFDTADRLAVHLGYAIDGFYRLEAGLLHYLNEISVKDGHSYVIQEEWIKSTYMLLFRNQEISEWIASTQDPQDMISREEYFVNILRDVADNLEANEVVCVENWKGEIRVYSKKNWHAEKRIAEWMLRRLRQQSQPLDTKEAREAVEAFAKEKGITFSLDQSKAIEAGLLQSMTLIIGGPGTGKTTVTEAIAKCYQKLFGEDKKLVLCAPTGRAARRLEEVTGLPASTVHRLLNLQISGLEIGNEPIDADLLICDELSMIELLVMDRLTERLSPRTKVVFIGDPDQLPSIGAGQVLRDLIDGNVPCIRLDTIHRQSNESKIIENAHRILHGQLVEDGDDFQRGWAVNDEEIQGKILEEIRSLLHSGWSASDLQVISAVNRGTIGTIVLNELLQEAINPFLEGKRQVTFGKRIWREGDRVMSLVNNTQKDVTNGEIGYISSFNDELTEILVLYGDKEVLYHKDEWDTLTHGYCISVHKAMGGEFPVVVLALSGSFTRRMLYVNLLYTAVTRAKSLIRIMCTKHGWDTATTNREPLIRKTGLRDRILKNIS